MRRLPALVGGRYEALRLLDEGGHSLVYLARDLRLGRLVALKVLKPELRGDVALVARLEREVRLVAQLSHPNLVTLYDWQADGSGQLAVLEYVSGENLKAYLRRRGRLAPDEAIAIVRQVLAALGAVHAAGIVHRDVKPQNVLLVGDASASGERDTQPTQSLQAYPSQAYPFVKLTDLGIARIVDDPGPTPLGSAVGTPQYLSPEQAMGQPATPVSDVYAVGALLYELLVGSPPFDGETPLAIVHQQAYVEPRPPREAVPGLSPELERVVLRALAKDPAQRYPTAAAFSSALEGLASGAPDRTATLTTLPTVSPGLLALGRLRGRLLPVLSAGLALAFVLAVLFGWLSSALDSPPTPRPTPATASPTTAALAAIATPTPRPTSTSPATATPTALLTGTPTPRPTDVPTPTQRPTATATSRPTATATATATAVPTPTPRPTPTQTALRIMVRPLSSVAQDIGALGAGWRAGDYSAERPGRTERHNLERSARRRRRARPGAGRGADASEHPVGRGGRLQPAARQPLLDLHQQAGDDHLPSSRARVIGAESSDHLAPREYICGASGG